MNLRFQVDDTEHNLPMPEADELPDLGRQIHSCVVQSCGERQIRKDLEARIHDGMLDALVDQTDLDLGQVIAG